MSVEGVVVVRRRDGGSEDRRWWLQNNQRWGASTQKCVRQPPKQSLISTSTMSKPLPTDEEKDEVLLACRYGDLEDIKNKGHWGALVFEVDRKCDHRFLVWRRPSVRCEVQITIILLSATRVSVKPSVAQVRY